MSDAEFDHKRFTELNFQYECDEFLIPEESAEFIKLQHEKILRLFSAIEFLTDYAAQTHQYWDKDEDHKVGKRLMAMAGVMASYDAGVTKALNEARYQ